VEQPAVGQRGVVVNHELPIGGGVDVEFDPVTRGRGGRDTPFKGVQGVFEGMSGGPSVTDHQHCGHPLWEEGGRGVYAVDIT
jgi:hypothetical protein